MMKRTSRTLLRRNRVGLAILGALFSAAGMSLGQTTYTWDVNQSAAGTGGTGIWNATNQFWISTSSGYVAWPNTTSEIASFGGSSGTVSISGGSFTVNSLQFVVGGYSVDSSSSTVRTITLGTGEVSVATGSTTFGGNLRVGGSAGLIKTGDGELVLSRAHDTGAYSGTTSISAGTIRMAANNALRDSGALTISGGATLNLAGRTQSISSGALSGSGIITSSSSGGEFHFSSTTSSDFLGVISGDMSLFKDTTGASSVLTLSGINANTYTGSTVVSIGTLELNKTGVNAVSGSSLVVGDGAGNGRVNLLQSNQISDSVAVTVNSGSKLYIAGNLEVVGSLTGSGIVDVDGTGSFTFGGNGGSTSFSGSVDVPATGTLTKQGSGKFTVQSGGSVAGGTINITGGIIELQSGATMTGVSGGAITVASGATISGSGGISGALAINGTHAPGTTGTVGSQAVTGSLSYGNNSIFEWDLISSKNSSTGTAGTDFDKVIAGSVSATNAIFKVVLGGTALDDIDNPLNAFWNTPYGTQTWSMSSIFGSAVTGFTSVQTSSDVSSYGSFSISGSNLTWTAVPEPTTALAGVLLGAGLLRRKVLR